MKIDVKEILSGDQLAGARLIRMLEEGDDRALPVLTRLYPHTGKAFVVGITGPAGAGKSTLVNGIIGEYRRKSLKVAVVAIDPTSPISGGALLGDRIRMGRHTEDDGVFIHSMATRGHPGGLSRTTREAVLVFDAMGYDVIVIETVGVGQDEVEIVRFAHCTAVVCPPGVGDDIQAMKAGLMEIGDVFIVNKADSPGADDMVAQLHSMIAMAAPAEISWQPPVIKTVATKKEGICELVEAFGNHRRFLMDSGRFHKNAFEGEFYLFRRLIMEMAAEWILDHAGKSPSYARLLADLKNRKIDPFTAARRLVDGLRRKSGG